MYKFLVFIKLCAIYIAWAEKLCYNLIIKLRAVLSCTI